MKNVLLFLTLLVSSLAFSQLNMTTEAAYGQEFEYHFKEYAKIDLTFSSDTALYWVESTSGTDANEEINTIHINDHATLTSWKERNKTIVTLYSDFASGNTYGYQYLRNGNVRKLMGTITLKSPAAMSTKIKDAKDAANFITNSANSSLIPQKPSATSVVTDSLKVRNTPAIVEETIIKPSSKTIIENKVFGKYPEASTKLLSLNDIKSLDTEALKIMRNEIFARYGHSFKVGGEMDLHFKSQPWYTSKNLDATTLISDIEKQNIALIRTLE